MEFNFSPNFEIIDWLIIVGYILLSIGIGIYYSRRGTQSTDQYFASGQGVPWWLLGTSMVATTFAADTPLAISGLVVKQGIWGNWFWWAQVPMFIFGVFFFARLWRRAKILTDTEFVALRYSGKPAKILRGFRAVYFALPYNCLIMGWVILSMTKILGLAFNMDKTLAIVISLAITMGYSSVSGLWGVMVTDFFQFFLAIGMAIYLAVISVWNSGGFAAILEKMETIYGPEKAASMTSIIPAASDEHFFAIFLIYILLMWWTVGNTDGGAYIAQRMIAAKNEKHSFLGYLWFNVAHFCLRPWPWIIVGLVAAVQFPGIINPHTNRADPEIGYIAVMLTYLKPGFLGLMLVSFLAAFMSTISTQINWGASYIVNDLYRPFIKKDASERHYVLVSIMSTIVMCILGGIIALFMHDIFMAWLLLSAINAGIGIVYIIRWYWWRINAWSEMSAILSIIAVVGLIVLADNIPFFSQTTFWLPSICLLQWILIFIVIIALVTLLIRGFLNQSWRDENFGIGLFVILLAFGAVWWIAEFNLPEKVFPWTLLYTVPISLVVWLTVTLLTPKVENDTLIEFYRRVHPGGPGWQPIAKLVQLKDSDTELFTPQNFMRASLAVIAVFAVLFGCWQLFLGSLWVGSALFMVTVVCTAILVRQLSSEKWESA